MADFTQSTDSENLKKSTDVTSTDSAASAGTSTSPNSIEVPAEETPIRHAIGKVVESAVPFGLYPAGKIDPHITLNSPNTSVNAKQEALAELDRRTQEHAADKFAKYQQYTKAVDDHIALSDQLKSRGVIANMPKMPEASDYDLAPHDIAIFSNQKAREEGTLALDEKRKQQAIEDSKKEEAANAARMQQEQALGMQQQDRQNNLILGQIASQTKLSQQMRDEYDKAASMIDTQQNQLLTIDPNKFWSDRTTGQRILGTVAIALGEVGKSLTGSSTNVALDIINKHIDMDIAAQKVNNEQKIALKQNALKRVEMQIQKIEAVSKDSTRQFEMRKMVNDIQAQREALKQQQIVSTALNNKLFNGGGIDPREAETMLTVEQKGRTITTPNGKLMLASSEPAAKKAQTDLGEYNGALAALRQFKQEADGLTADEKMNPLSPKTAAVLSSLNALVGKLRVPITGPGVLTPSEEKRIREEVLGDPTRLFTTKGLFEARTGALERLLKVGAKATYAQAGVQLPMTKAENMRIRLYKAKLKPEAVEAKMNELALSNPEYAD